MTTPLPAPALTPEQSIARLVALLDVESLGDDRFRGHSTEAVDKRIAVERMRIVRSDLDRATPARAATLEITAKRTNPQDQSAKIIYDDKGKAVGYIAPPTTYFGKPKMPPKAPVRNY